MANIAVAVAVLVAYFVPSFVAAFRNHPLGWPVLAVNVFLGWTLVGWVAALVMAAWPIKPTPA